MRSSSEEQGVKLFCVIRLDRVSRHIHLRSFGLINNHRDRGITFPWHHNENLSRSPSLAVHGLFSMQWPLQEVVFPLPMGIAGSLGSVPDERKCIHLRIQYIRFPNARRDFF